MVTRKPPTIDQVHSALRPVDGWLRNDSEQPARPVLADAVRISARYLAGAYPGGAVEVRIPPFVAVQCIQGLTHKRGTPPNVVETDSRTWLELVTGAITWETAVRDARVRTSGSRATLAELLPIVQSPAG
ncbi:MAG: sterol carrier family protein [Antricoccus sp.]